MRPKRLVHICCKRMRLPAGSSYYTASNTLLLLVRWRCCAVRLLRSGTTSTAISYYVAHTRTTTHTHHFLSLCCQPFTAFLSAPLQLELLATVPSLSRDSSMASSSGCCRIVVTELKSAYGAWHPYSNHSLAL
jgi:hypothetical protein